MELLYKWANDPETRANSINSDPIIFDVHKNWFNKKINSKKVLFYIYHNENQDIGQVRFDVKGDIAIIDYSIAPPFRDKGYGCRMMALAEKEIQDNCPAVKWIQAEVKNENKASQNIFRKLDYTEFRGFGLVKFIKSTPPPPQ
jgi:RimJ/RimL family protein N-acetyltransferase